MTTAFRFLGSKHRNQQENHNFSYLSLVNTVPKTNDWISNEKDNPRELISTKDEEKPSKQETVRHHS